MLPTRQPLAFLDVVHQLELARLFQEDRLGLDVGKHVALAAVQLFEPGDVGVHLVLLERLRTGRQRLDVVVRLLQRGAFVGSGFSSTPVASDSLEKILLPMNDDAFDLVARAFVDHEPQREPLVLFVEHRAAGRSWPGSSRTSGSRR